MLDITVGREYGNKFEEKVVQAILGDDRFAEQIMEILDPDLFTLGHMKELVVKVRDFYARYGHIPTADALEGMVHKDVDVLIVRDKCLKYLESIKTHPLNGDSQWVKEQSLNFFKTQHLKTVLKDQVLPRIKSANFDEILPVIQRAVEKGVNRDIGLDYTNDEEKRFSEESRPKVPSPWPYINQLLEGGWEVGRLITCIGASGVGKSHICVNVGVGALKAGKTVVHYTLELDEIDVSRRYDACLTNTAINDVPNNKEKVLHVLKSVLPSGARLIVKEFPMKQASVQTLKSHLSMLKIQGVVPDIIVLDYGDLMRPAETGNGESWENVNIIWRELKALAQEMKLPVFTVTQTNRSGYNADLVTPDQIADAYGKVMVSDIIFTFARNMEQKQAGCGKIFWAKNRQGEDGFILGYTIDTSRSLVLCHELTESSDDELEKELDDGNNLVKKMQKYAKGKN